MPRVLLRGFASCVLALVSGYLAFTLFVPQTRAANGLNRQINYQAKLLDASGSPVADGNYSIKFSLYDAASGGNRVWTATGTTVVPTALPISVQSGLLSLMLGDTSATGGWQNELTNVNWNSDGLYLGVTVGTDAEMSPRKRLGSVPQALNSEQLQGMYASGTASGGQNLFVVNQTENNAATGTRAALTVRSSGTSNSNDYLIRGLDDGGSQVFSVNRQGSVTSSGVFRFNGTTTSTIMGGLTVGTSTQQVALSSLFSMDGDDLFLQGNFGSVTSVYTNGAFIAGSANETYYGNGFINQTSGNLVLSAVGGFVTPSADRGVSLGSAALRYDAYLGNTTSTNATSSNQTVLQGLTAGVFSNTSLSAVGTLGFVTSSRRMVANGSMIYAISTSTDELVVIDATNPTSPKYRASIGTGGTEPRALAIQGKYAYVVNNGDGSLSVIDLAVSSTGDVVGRLTGLVDVRDIAVSGAYAYVSRMAGNEVDVIDISNPTRPRQIGSVAIANSPIAIAARGTFVYTAAWGTGLISVIDATNPRAPLVIGTVAGIANAYKLAIEGNHLYLGGWSAVRVYDVTDPAQPTLLGSMEALGDLIIDLDVKGGLVAALQVGSIRMIDFRVPTSPQLVSTLAVDNPWSIVMSGQTLFVGDAEPNNTLRAYSMPGVEAVSLRARSAEVGGLSVDGSAVVQNDLNVGGALAVGGGGLISNGRFSVSATNTTSTVLGNLAVGTSSRDIAYSSLFNLDGDDLMVGGNIGSASSVYSNSAFIAGSSNETYYGNGFINQTSGNFVLNAAGGFIRPTSDRGVSLGSSGQRYDAYLGNVTSTNATSASVFVTQSLKNIFNSSSSLNIVATSSATLPTGLDVVGKYLYVADQGSGLRIIDVSNPTAPSSTALANVGASPGEVKVVGRYAYVANVGVTNRLTVVDVGDKTNPQVLGTISMNAPDLFAVQGKYAYLSSYNGGSIHIVDISNPTLPAMAASTTYAGARGLAVNGNYMYAVSQTANTFRVYDISKPSNPIQLASLAVAATPHTLTLAGNYVYVGHAGMAPGFSVIDVSNPNAPFVKSTLNVAEPPNYYSASIDGRYLYFAGTSGGLRVLDIQNPSSLTEVASLADAGYQGMAVSGRYLYLDDHMNSRIAIIDLGGLETTALSAHSAEVGSLQVLNDETIAGTLNVGRSLGVGHGGIFSDGPLVLASTNTSSTFLGSVYFSASSSSPGVNITNSNATGSGTGWGAYIDKLLVGGASTATGTSDFSMVIQYTSGSNAGLCLDNTQADGNCLASSAVSIFADDAINAAAFDLAERYDISGDVQPGDVLVMDETVGRTVKQSPGVAYDRHVLGVASTDPGLLLGVGGGASLALAGRVPTKVSPVNGAIAIGDPLVAAPYAGMAMKATKPGTIIGYALEATNATGTIEVFVKVGFNAGTLLTTDGQASLVTDDLVMAPISTASVSNQTVDSWGLTFRGSAWDGASAVTTNFVLANDVLSATSSRWTIADGAAAPLFSIDESGTARVTNDLIVGGRLYPSLHGAPQNQTYLFVDQAQGSTSTYIATNAAGWQADDAYDFAERYYSPDALSPGDLVVVSQRGQLHVQRAWNEQAMPMGIVSTKPGFVTGRPATSTYPIALMGRVPTKVSTLNGAIVAGDMLAPSSIPGVAVKANIAGPVVGQALENYDSPEIGMIETFVNPIWWSGTAQTATTDPPVATITVASSTNQLVAASSYRGLAAISAGSFTVHVTFPSLQALPNVQVTPRGEVEGGWWTDNYSDSGFDILLKQPQTRDLTFNWRVDALQDGERVYHSDGTNESVNPTTGSGAPQTRATTTAALLNQTGVLPNDAVIVPPLETLPLATTSTPTIAPLDPTTTTTSSTINPPPLTTGTAAQIFPVFEPSAEDKPGLP